MQNLSEAQNQQQVQVQNQGAQIQNLSETQNQQQVQVQNQGAQIQNLHNRQDQQNEQIAALRHLHITTPAPVNIGNVLYVRPDLSKSLFCVPGLVPFKRD